MKLIFLSFFLIIFSLQTTQGQVIEPPTDKSSETSFDFYSLKQKKNKTTAWILLGGGLALTIYGLAINTADESARLLSLGLFEIEDEHDGDWMIYVGSAATIASIPFFVSAGKNKKKATLSLNNAVSSIKSPKFNKKTYTSVSLAIQF